MSVASVALTELTGLVGAAYTDVDLDSFVTVPSGATGCIILVNNPSATNYSSDVRTNGSTDSHAVTHNAGDWFAYAVKLAADHIVEIYVGNTAMKAYVRDFFGSESVFFTNSVLKSLASGSWLDVDISADTGADTAIGAYIKLHSIGGSRLAGLRKNGSTDNRVLTCDNALGIVGVDASEIFECQTNDTDMDPYLVGYCTTGATFDTNATDKSIGTTGAYADADTLDSGKSHGVYEFANGAADVLSWLRKKGATDDIYSAPCFAHNWNVVEGDASRIIEGKISATTGDWFRVGQFDAPGGTIYSRTVSEAISVSDLTGTSRIRNRFIAEQLSLSEALIRAVRRTRITNDAVEVTELSNGLGFIAYGRVLSDAVQVSDVVARREAKLFRLLADDLSVRESLDRTIFNAIVYVRTLTDSVDVLDGLIRAAKIFRKMEDSVESNDQLLRLKHVNRQLLDSIAVSTATLRGLVHGRVVTESVDLYESVFREVWLRRVLTDSIDIDDDLASTITLASTAIGFVLMHLESQGFMELRQSQPISMRLGKNAN